MLYGLKTLVRACARAVTTGCGLSAAAALSATALAAVLALGCSSQKPASPSAAPPPPPPSSPGSPQVITNLSQLSSNDAEAASLNNAAKVLKCDPSRDETLPLIAHGAGEDRPSTLRRLFLDNPQSPRYAETLLPHTQERLLNAKAAEYPDFSNMMLAQLLLEMVKQEKVEPMVTLELSEEVRPVILIAVLDDRGQLKELIYQQHSGLAAIDNFVIAVCKASLWGNNMPKGAMFADGHYRLRIEAQLSKYRADREGNQTFTTRVGLGIL